MLMKEIVRKIDSNQKRIDDKRNTMINKHKQTSDDKKNLYGIDNRMTSIVKSFSLSLVDCLSHEDLHLGTTQSEFK